MERTPGNAIEVYLGGKLAFQYACGFSDLETKKPMNGSEMFHIYSCSKIATVTAGAQLLEQGKILLHDPLYEYIPEFKDMCIKNADGSLSKAKNLITVRDLFTMTAGFDYDLSAPGFQRAKELTKGNMDTVATIKCVASDPLSYEPGTHWQYSIGHDVLAALVSVISGRKFRDYVREHIFLPLGMSESVYHPTAGTLKRMASQYRFVPSDGVSLDDVQAQIHGSAKDGIFTNVGKVNSFILGEEYDSGGAGIITTVSDYAKLTAALSNGGVGLTGERILSPYTIDLIRADWLTPVQRVDYNWNHLAGYSYGLGVRTHISPAESGSISSLDEFGWGGAAGATTIIDPKIKLGVFYVQHTLNSREEYYQPRLRNVVYSCL